MRFLPFHFRRAAVAGGLNVTSHLEWNNPIVQLACTRREGKPSKKPGGEPAAAERYRTKLKFVCKQLMIHEIVVEAAGVELSSVLTARKLLILGTATRAKKAPLSDTLYVYCTKMLSASGLLAVGRCVSIPQMQRKCSNSSSLFAIVAAMRARWQWILRVCCRGFAP